MYEIRFVLAIYLETTEIFFGPTYFGVQGQFLLKHEFVLPQATTRLTEIAGTFPKSDTKIHIREWREEGDSRIESR